MNICAVPCRLDQSAVLVAILRAKIIRLGKACGSRGQRCPRPAIVQSLIPKSKGVPIVPVTVSSGPSLLHPIPGSCAASAVITVCAVSILYLPWYLSSTASRQQLRVFRTFLTQPLPGASPSLLRAGAGPPTTVAQDRRIRVHELSTDVYDELLRREDDRQRKVPDVPRYLLPKPSFHPKRNQARQKLSTLPPERFRQLATDVFYELERRIPRFAGVDISRVGSPAGSAASSQRAPSRQGGMPNGMRGPPGGPGGFRGPPGSGPGYQSYQPSGPGSRPAEHNRPEQEHHG
ncbi:component of the polarisome [Zalaria obscura]|uniref:Component of the polarisome n=1 Tax=Zalaria obscura TaxID=2024903 RepID=A0ACC3S6H0_9PEZI